MYKKYCGVILKKHPFDEADELLTVYTKEEGKLRFKSKGVRKIKSRLAGHLQTMNEIEFESAGRSRLPVIVSVRLKKLNNYLREDLRKFALAQVGAETLYRISADQDANQEVYEVLVNFLDELGRNTAEKRLLRGFQLEVLKLHGYDNQKLRPDMEEEIDEFIEYVLEREVRANNFLNLV